MGIALTPRFQEELGKCSNMPNVVVEMELDGGTVRYGYHGRNAVPPEVYRADGTWMADGEKRAIGSDELPFVLPAIRSVSSLQNRIDVRSGYTTRGQFSVVIAGRENFVHLIRDEHIKNRRVRRKDGFISGGFTWLDYADTFNGKVLDWSRRGDELTVVIADDLKEASARIPAESESRDAFIEYRAKNPVDIMTDIIVSRLGVDASLVDLGAFALERDRWLSSWKFDRTLTEPLEANQFLNELQVESNSFIVHDGERISLKVFAPPSPGQAVEEWTDRVLLRDSLAVKSGYKEGFCNRVVVYYDYDESGGDRESNFESAVIVADAASQSSSQWNETSTRTIKSKWIRTHTFTEGPGVGGVKVYHASLANGEGFGQLSFSRNGMSLTWAAPGGAAGEAVKLTRDGKYQVFDADRNRYVRVLVTTGSLPAADAVSAVSVTAIGGGNNASTLAAKLLNRYRDPVATMSFDVDINCMAAGGFIKPTDMKDLTTEEACGKGAASWVRNRVMLTSVRPDFASGRVSVEGVETKMSLRYAFIAPAGHPDYSGATGAQRGYGFIGDASNLTGGADGYHIW